MTTPNQIQQAKLLSPQSPMQDRTVLSEKINKGYTRRKMNLSGLLSSWPSIPSSQNDSLHTPSSSSDQETGPIASLSARLSDLGFPFPTSLFLLLPCLLKRYSNIIKLLWTMEALFLCKRFELSKSLFGTGNGKNNRTIIPKGPHLIQTLPCPLRG